jgi:energy-coupling factor transporter ATP-binding protein EcfA2
MTEGQSVTAAARDQGAGAGAPADPEPAAPAVASAAQEPAAPAAQEPAAPAAQEPAAPAVAAPAVAAPAVASAGATHLGAAAPSASQPGTAAPSGATAAPEAASTATTGAAATARGATAAVETTAPAGPATPAGPASPPETTAPAETATPPETAAARGTSVAAGSSAVPPDGPPSEPPVRVNAQLIESAILALRKPIVAAQLPLEAPGVEEARAERHKLLGQIDDYLLPRLRESGSPILVALVGSTGAGKSTLVNSIVGAHVSMTGIRRPTTNSPVLACHPADLDWFAENVFLPTVPRVRQEGLARSGRDGLLVLAASEGMPKGVALLDTPDIDSVVQEHRDFAHQFLDASDLWLFMTTASRYADAAVWDLLQHARDRGAALGIVLSRVNEASAPQLIDHFGAMLEANGLGSNQRFLILETMLSDGMLPAEASGPIQHWLAEAARSDRRVAVLTQTMSGMLDTFPTRVPALAAHVEAQAGLRDDLIAAVTGAYRAALAEIETSTADGSLLRGEVLARWQDFASTGDLLRALQTRRTVGRQRRRRSPARAQALRSALRTALESLLISVADRAAEVSVSRWRDHPAGAALLDQLGVGGDSDDWSGSQFAIEAGVIFGFDPAAGGSHGAAGDDGPEQAVARLGRASADLATHAARAVSSWQDQVLRVVKAENVTKRSIARIISFDDESLATVLMIGLLVQDAPEAEVEESTTAIPQRLLTALFGAGPLRDIARSARLDLLYRLSLIFDEEMLRFSRILGGTEVPDASAALQLYQATYALEVTR